MSIEFWLFLPICCFSFAGWLSFRATLRRLTRFNGFLPLCVPFGDPKGTEKVPATSDSAGGPAKGARPLGTPKRKSDNKKAKKCRSAAFFLTLFHCLPYSPLRGVDSSTRYRVFLAPEGSMREGSKSPLRKCSHSCIFRRFGA